MGFSSVENMGGQILLRTIDQILKSGRGYSMKPGKEPEDGKWPIIVETDDLTVKVFFPDERSAQNAALGSSGVIMGHDR